MKGRTSSEGIGRGFRKAILVNEHFVVYGVPAIAVPISLPVEVTVSIRGGSGLSVLTCGVCGDSPRQDTDSDRLEAARSVLRAMDLPDGANRIEIRCVDDLPGWSGLGSSAGFCVALVRALCEALTRPRPDEEINRIAYEGERVFASNPSGIDNTVATYGQPIWFERGKTPSWEGISVGRPLWIVIGYSGTPARTRDEVEKVARFRNTRAAAFSEMVDEARSVGAQARAALKAGDGVALGALMDRGHSMLRQLGVSNERLEEMVAFCRREGALGAKLTGGGGGGCMLALAGDKPSGEAVAGGLERRGYPAICFELERSDARRP